MYVLIKGVRAKLTEPWEGGGIGGEKHKNSNIEPLMANYDKG